MANVLQFGRQQQGRSKVRRRPGRVAHRLWLPWIVLSVVATAGYFSADRHSDRIHGFGDFSLCGRAHQQTCVVDGDTIRYGGVTIRLEDIDAPETFSPKCASEAALGRRATQRLLDLMNAGPFEVVHDGGRDEDIYGRKLRIIERNGRPVTDTLVAEGLARPWDGARRSWCG